MHMFKTITRQILPEWMVEKLKFTILCDYSTKSYSQEGEDLISNIGFDENATHTTGVSELANLARDPIGFPLTHPPGVFKNIQADQFSYRKCFRVPLLKRVRNKLAGWLR